MRIDDIVLDSILKNNEKLKEFRENAHELENRNIGRHI